MSHYHELRLARYQREQDAQAKLEDAIGYRFNQVIDEGYTTFGWYQCKPTEIDLSYIIAQFTLERGDLLEQAVRSSEWGAVEAAIRAEVLKQVKDAIKDGADDEPHEAYRSKNRERN